MTQYLVNRSSLDEVSLEINQTGNSEASLNLKVPLLDDKKSYVFAVDSLIVPLDNAPIFDLDNDVELFRIQRRNVGLQLNTNLNCGTVVYAADIANVAIPIAIYKVERKIYDVPSLVSNLNNFARGFELQQTLLGIADDIGRNYGAAQAVLPPIDVDDIVPLNLIPAVPLIDIQNLGTNKFLNFKLLNDGTLVIQGTSDFWNNFFFDFTAVGRETLGFTPSTREVELIGPVPNLIRRNHYILSVTRRANGVITHDFRFGEAPAMEAGLFSVALGGIPANIEPFVGAGLQVNRELALANMNSDYQIYSQHSLFQCADQRLKITVDSHLPTLSNVSIVNSKESIDRSIAEFYFEKNITSSTTFDSDGHFESSKITTNIYSGQYSLIKKSGQYKKWTKLQTAYEIRFFRFMLNIFYRTYDSLNEKWNVTKQSLKVPDDMYWSMLIRFVSEV